MAACKTSPSCRILKHFDLKDKKQHFSLSCLSIELTTFQDIQQFSTFILSFVKQMLEFTMGESMLAFTNLFLFFFSSKSPFEFLFKTKEGWYQPWSAHNTKVKTFKKTIFSHCEHFQITPGAYCCSTTRDDSPEEWRES